MFRSFLFPILLQGEGTSCLNVIIKTETSVSLFPGYPPVTLSSAVLSPHFHLRLHTVQQCCGAESQ